MDNIKRWSMTIVYILYGLLGVICLVCEAALFGLIVLLGISVLFLILVMAC